VFVLVSYDVAISSPGGARRLRRVAKTCINFGQRVQFSVFECVVEPAQWVTLQKTSSSRSSMRSTTASGIITLVPTGRERSNMSAQNQRSISMIRLLYESLFRSHECQTPALWSCLARETLDEAVCSSPSANVYDTEKIGAVAHYVILY